jgi:hypothetical protein
MVPASCHCGAVRMEVDGAPEEVTDCNCSICRRYGVLWAYYSPSRVKFIVPAETDVYLWGDRDIEFHRCKVCGCVTHWKAVEPTHDRMGVNTRLMSPEVRAGARVRRLDGADTWKFLDE